MNKKVCKHCPNRAVIAVPVMDGKKIAYHYDYCMRCYCDPNLRSKGMIAGIEARSAQTMSMRGR